MSRACRPELDEWRGLCAQYTQHEIAMHLGKSEGLVANWGKQHNVFPLFLCDTHECGYRGPREDFISYRRCKSCAGKKRRAKPATRRPRTAAADVELIWQPAFPATPGRLAYWCQL